MQHLTRAQLLKLLRCAKRSSERDWLLILVAFWHGLRASEIVGNNGFSANSVQDGHLAVSRLKGSLKTIQPLIKHKNPLLNEREALERRAVRFHRGPLFPISRMEFWRIMRKHCESAGIPSHKAHPHVLKHSIAMQTIKKAGIENVRQYLGHKSISSTGSYLRVSDDVASSAIAKASRSKV